MRSIVAALGTLPIAGLLSLAVPTAAHANRTPVIAGPQIRRSLPSYTCDWLSDYGYLPAPVGPYSGEDNCTTASLPQHGRIVAAFIIRRRIPRFPFPDAVSCAQATSVLNPSGYAGLPKEVWGKNCRPIN